MQTIADVSFALSRKDVKLWACECCETHRFLHTHKVLLRLLLTTADEKLSKVTVPW